MPKIFDLQVALIFSFGLAIISAARKGIFSDSNPPVPEDARLERWGPIRQRAASVRFPQWQKQGRTVPVSVGKAFESMSRAVERTRRPRLLTLRLYDVNVWPNSPCTGSDPPPWG